MVSAVAITSLLAVGLAIALGYSHWANVSAPTILTVPTSGSVGFLQAITIRRSIYPLGAKSSLSNAEIIKLIQECIRQAPSSFNSQSSRAIILLDDEHKKFWLQHLKTYGNKDVVGYMSERLPMFAAGKGTVLFFEDEAVIKSMQERNAAFAPAFPGFSAQSSGMAQFATWTALAQEGLGANLQHLGGASGESYVEGLAKLYKFPTTWKPYAELVFGSVEKPAGEKTFIDNAERFRIVSN